MAFVQWRAIPRHKVDFDFNGQCPLNWQVFTIYLVRTLAETPKTKPGENKVLLPKDAPQLVPGVRYYWKVKGFERAEMEPHTSKLCWFAILGPGESEQLKAEIKKIYDMGGLDEDSRGFLEANLLISYGLYHRAVSILRQGLQRFPEDEGLKELLIGLFLKMKRFEEAEKLH